MKKAFHKRELVKLTDISGSTLNDLINGKIKKVDIDAQKRRKVSDVRQKLFYTMDHLQIMRDNKDSLYTIDKAIEDIKYAFDESEDIEYKYDYDKLPKDN